MNTDAKQIRLSLTFILGAFAASRFWYLMGFLTPGFAMKDYYYPVLIGSFILIEVLCFAVEQLIVHLKRDRKEIEWEHAKRYAEEVDEFWDLNVGFAGGHKFLGRAEIKECCKLIDKICKDKYLSIEYKKIYYDKLCQMWTKYDMGEVYRTIPPEIQMKWKKAQADDKLRQLKKDF